MEKKKCLTCAHGLWAVAHPREVLVCRSKDGGKGRLHVRKQKEVVAFEPSAVLPRSKGALPPGCGRKPKEAYFGSDKTDKSFSRQKFRNKFRFHPSK